MIAVVDNAGLIEEIGNTRDSLVTDLITNAQPEYAIMVLNWYIDTDEPFFVTKNGRYYTEVWFRNY